MGNAFNFNWEPGLIEWLQSHMGNFGVKLASVCSAFGEELILIAILCFLYFVYDKNTGKFVAKSLMVTGVLNSELKNIFCRLRPYFVHDNVKILKPVDPDADLYDVAAQGYSFPSGHSSNASSVYVGAAVYMKKRIITIIAIILTLLVGISRFCVGAHYPTDVLCGWAVGIVSIVLICILEKYCSRKWVIYVILAVIGLPGIFFCTTNDYFTNYGMMLGFFLGDLFECRYVKFENTKNVLRGILRMLGGAAVYLVLNTLLKLPFGSEFLDSGTLAAHLVRLFRYMIVLFSVIGAYPLLFRFTARIGNTTK